jgi:Thiamine pyrophosphate enzyme, N-terminal TPP binding domain
MNVREAKCFAKRLARDTDGPRIAVLEISGAHSIFYWRICSRCIGVLEQIGVKHIFGLIGDSLNPLADAIRRSEIEWIGVRHEEGGGGMCRHNRPR